MAGVTQHSINNKVLTSENKVLRVYLKVWTLQLVVGKRTCSSLSQNSVIIQDVRHLTIASALNRHCQAQLEPAVKAYELLEPVICLNGGNSTYTIVARETNLIGHCLTSFLRLACSKSIISSAIFAFKCYLTILHKS